MIDQDPTFSVTCKVAHCYTQSVGFKLQGAYRVMQKHVGRLTIHISEKSKSNWVC